jgi:hypothetical protein
MSPAARARAYQKTRALERLIAEGRAGGESVDGEAVLKRLRRKYASKAGVKTRRKPRDGE